MNFRTTLILFVLLLAGLAVLYFTRETGNAPSAAPIAGDDRKLVTLAIDQVQQVEITNDDGQLTLRRDGDDWRMTAPVNAKADHSAVEGLLSSLTSATSQGQVEIAGNEKALGLDQPVATLTLTPKTGDPVKLTVGGRTGTGGNVYVRVGAWPKADLAAAVLIHELSEPAKHYRDVRLVSDPSTDLRHIVLTDAEGFSIELVRQGGQTDAEGAGWRMLRPFEAAADAAAVSDITFALAGLRAIEFIDKPAEGARYGLDTPQLVVRYSTGLPSTQPTSSQPAQREIRIGKPEDVLGRNVYADAGGAVVKIATTSLDSLRKKPLELRDRALLSLAPDTVARVTIAREDTSATQPSAPVVLVREEANDGTTQPTAARWRVASAGNAEADQASVDALLRMLNPYRVNRYLESVPLVATGPSVTLTIETTSGQSHVLRLYPPTDGSLTARGAYNELQFEAARTIVDAAAVDFVKPAPPATVPTTQPAP